MITIPINTLWFISIVSVAVIILIVLVTLETNHLDSRRRRKSLQAREDSVSEREGAVGKREDTIEQAIEEAVEERVHDREQTLRQREIELGRKAHDVSTQVRMAIAGPMDDDTVISSSDVGTGE
jgi:ABC-type multidrug transport system fused ATPase/permease subunit